MERENEEWEKFLQTGGTYLRLHGQVCVIVELPKETEPQKINQNVAEPQS